MAAMAQGLKVFHSSAMDVNLDKISPCLPLHPPQPAERGLDTPDVWHAQSHPRGAENQGNGCRPRRRQGYKV